MNLGESEDVVDEEQHVLALLVPNNNHSINQTINPGPPGL